MRTESPLKVARRIVPLVLVATLAAGCGDEDPTGVEDGLTIEDLVGSWIATSVTHTNKANPAETFDIVGAGGEVRSTILTGGRARTWVEFGSSMDEWDSLATLSGTIITSVPTEAGRPTRTWEFTLVGGVLTLTDDGEFDFTLTGATPVSTTEVIVSVRN